MRSLASRLLPILVLAPAFLSTGCGIETSSTAPLPRIPAEVDRLAGWMTGSFDNTAQAAREPSLPRLSLHACRIWPDRTDGRWIYAEQSLLADPERPQRQQIRRLRIDGLGHLVSEVFAFRSGEKPPAGAWRNPETLDRIDPFLLLPLEGCTVHFTFDADCFRGETSGVGCEDARSGATYQTTELRVENQRISSWDRGYDETGDQVWGSKSGPFLFDRKPGRSES